MTAYLYTLTGPTGKVCAGVSKNPRNRWNSHLRRARTTSGRHPLYDSLRKYGPGAFALKVLKAYETAQEALDAEVEYIHLHCLTDPKIGYNVSPGGEYDAGFGGVKFWSEIKADPPRFEAYLAKLRAAQANRIHDDSHLVAYNAAKSAKERWRLIWRAIRCSRRDPSFRSNRKGCVGNGYADLVRSAWLASPPSHKKRHQINARRTAREQWASLSPTRKAEILGKISATHKAKFAAGPAWQQELRERANRGRARMDRAKQGAAASSGLKRWWADPKQDPDRYAAYMAARTSSLLKTLAKK